GAILFLQAEDGLRDFHVTGVQTCALPIYADIDQKMRRTSRRPLPRHHVTTQDALVFGLVLGVLSTAWLGLTVNWLSSALALAARSEERRVGKERSAQGSPVRVHARQTAHR